MKLSINAAESFTAAIVLLVAYLVARRRLRIETNLVSYCIALENEHGAPRRVLGELQ